MVPFVKNQRKKQGSGTLKTLSYEIILFSNFVRHGLIFSGND